MAVNVKSTLTLLLSFLLHQQISSQVQAIAVSSDAAIDVEDQETFDHLMLSQEWPYTFCSENKCQNSDLLQPVFNIHGLWPEDVQGQCQGDFDYSQLAALVSRLRKAWMDLKNPTGDPKDFWSYEYNKHGKCATADPRYASTRQYFEAALQVYTQYNITQMLVKAGIVPGPTPYTVASIADAVQTSFGFPPEIECLKSSKQNSEAVYLSEIRICFNKDLTPRSCSSSSSSSSSSAKSPKNLSDNGALLYSGLTKIQRSKALSAQSGLDTVPWSSIVASLKADEKKLGSYQCDPDVEVTFPSSLNQ